jgi:outer membrane lipoprotein LolB
MTGFHFPAAAHAARRACLCAAAASMMLGGCAGMKPAPSSPAVDNQAARTYFGAIELDGRLSVRYQRNGKDEAVHGSFSWAQTPDRTSVTLLSPLGQIIAVIDVDAGSATMRQANQPPRTAADADALAAETLGWPLPIAGLRHWLQGFGTDADGRQFVALPANSRAVHVTRDGWRIRYADWEADAASMRPKRIDLQRATDQAGEVSIRIAIDTWQTR